MTPVTRPLGFERGLTVVAGVIAVLAGAGGLASGAGWLGASHARRPVLEPLAIAWLAGNWRLAVLGTFALGLLLFTVGSWWVARSLRPEERPDMHLEQDGTGITTDITVAASALAEAIQADAASVTGVRRARARMVCHGSPTVPLTPALRLTLSLRTGTDLRQVWTELEDGVLARARQSLEVDALPTAIRLELDKAAPERVS